MTLIAFSRRIRPKRAIPTLILMTGEAPLNEVIAAMARLPRGAAVIFRHYAAKDRHTMAAALRRLSRARGLIFLVAGDVRLALAVRADGFHAPEGLARPARAFRARRPTAFVTVAAHGAKGLIAAQQMGASAAILSPVFRTPSHPGARVLGAVQFSALVRASRLPVIALGGIDAETARRLTGAGQSGLAAISGLMNG